MKFIETLSNALEDADIEIENESETNLKTETLSVETEENDEHEKVKVTVQHEDGGFEATFQVPSGDEDSQEALAQVILDQLNYWGDI